MSVLVAAGLGTMTHIQALIPLFSQQIGIDFLLCARHRTGCGMWGCEIGFSPRYLPPATPILETIEEGAFSFPNKTKMMAVL